MSIAIKFLFYIAVFVGMYYFNVETLLSEFFEIPGQYIALLYFILYILLVLSEVTSRMRKGEEYVKVRKAAFMLSFCIGVIWGVMGSFADGSPFEDISPLELIWLLANYVLFGLLFGFMGRGLANLGWEIRSELEHKKETSQN